jgi:tight adherence protein B
MSITVIVLTLLATLTFVVVGVAVLARERARQASFTLAVNPRGGSWLNRLRRGVEKRLTRTSQGRRLRWALDNADLPWPVADTLLVAAVVFVFLCVLAYQIGGPVLLLVVAGLLLTGSRAAFRRREERRHAKFVEQLPELARLLANATSAGLSLRASIAVAAQESAEPTKGELQRVTEELSVGSSVETALERMGQRLPSRELAVLVNVLVIQARAGGRIVTALQGITQALETRRDLRREVNTLLAGSKATVMAVAFLGGLMVLLVHNSVEGGLRGLLANPIGLVIFFVSGALFAFGMALIRRTTRVEV